MITVISPGALATVQDLGRRGYACLGVAGSGAFDRAALRLANRLVGNHDGAPALELTLGAALCFDVAATVALTGAACSGLDWGRPVSLRAGTTVHLSAPARGLRSYLAVRGGLAAPRMLGSSSTDVLSGLGPPPLRAGDVLAIGATPERLVSSAEAVPGPPVDEPTLRVVLGPRQDWFTPPALTTLTSASWSALPASNRVGVRLDGPHLARSRFGELPSEPMIPGALQIPPDGRPILLGPDGPVTGGYPVIAVVRASDLDVAAQLRPGQRLRFRAG